MAKRRPSRYLGNAAPIIEPQALVDRTAGAIGSTKENLWAQIKKDPELLQMVKNDPDFQKFLGQLIFRFHVKSIDRIKSDFFFG